jgi:L-glutamine-phosphate cytidylyltransferase
MSIRTVILAAGRGTRLGPLAADRPKLMVELAGEPLLVHQLRALAAAGVDDVHVVVGHGQDAVRTHPAAAELTFWENPDFATTNMVATLMRATGALDGSTDLLIAYGDIVYEPRLVRAVLEVDASVVVAVDHGWHAYWSARMDDPLDDAETLRLGPSGRILELGGRPSSLADIEGQYLGLVRVRADRVRDLVACWEGFDEHVRFGGRTAAGMFMTDLLQHLIDIGWDVHEAPVEHGWLEVDQPADLAIDHARFWRPLATD